MVTLRKECGRVYVELAEDYWLYLCQEEFLKTLTARDIVLLVNLTIMEYQRQGEPN